MRATGRGCTTNEPSHQCKCPTSATRLPQPVKRAPGIFARFSKVTATGKCIRRRKNAKIVKATRSRVLSATTQTEIPFCSNHARHHPSWCGRCGGTEHRQPILPHKTYVTGAGGQADAVEVFQNLDRHLPAIVETVTERCRRELGSGIVPGSLSGDRRHLRHRLAQEEMIRCPLRSASRTRCRRFSAARIAGSGSDSACARSRVRGGRKRSAASRARTPGHRRSSAADRRIWWVVRRSHGPSCRTVPRRNSVSRSARNDAGGGRSASCRRNRSGCSPGWSGAPACHAASVRSRSCCSPSRVAGAISKSATATAGTAARADSATVGKVARPQEAGVVRPARRQCQQLP